MSLNKRAQEIVEERHANELDSVRADLRAEKARARNLATRVAELERERSIAEAVSAAVLAPPKWARPTKKGTSRRATAGLLLSDLHYQEVVDPAAIGGLGAYDSEIAARRIRSAFDDGIKLARGYSGDLTYDGSVVALDGDAMTGIIHEELRETNDQAIFPALVSLAEMIAAGIHQWADEFGNVLVPCQWGNHGRLTEKKKAKGAAGENLDWMLARMVEAHFAGDERVTVQHTLSPWTLYQVYEQRFLLTHGNHGVGASAGNGWGGAFVSVGKSLAKIRQQMAAARVAYDWVQVGHWHQFHATSGLMMNGTTKGPDEWSMQMGFAPEPPSQTLWITTPERGVTDVRQVFVEDRKSEGW